MTRRSSAEALNAEVVRADALAPADALAWRRLQAATPEFGSPLLSPDFAVAVGGVRDDARVAVFRRADAAVGFLAYHHRPGAFARPIGAPFSDEHALVAARDAGIGLGAALQGAGLGAFRLNGAVDPFRALTPAFQARIWTHRVVLTDGADAYLDGLWRSSANRLKNYRRYRRSLDREVGLVTLVADDRDPAAFERLLGWKREQLVRTGLHDVYAPPWASALMRALFALRTADFGGLMISLYAGSRLAAAHFGVRQGGWFHPWLSAYDPELREHSPGMVHQVEAIAAMGETGLTTYDLGPGEDHWKRQFALGGAWLGVGFATVPTLPGLMAEQSERLWRLPALRAPLATRVRHRLDHIAATELTLTGRLRGAARAAMAQGRRQWAA